jgi:hypothetical protein
VEKESGGTYRMSRVTEGYDKHVILFGKLQAKEILVGHMRMSEDNIKPDHQQQQQQQITNFQTNIMFLNIISCPVFI